MIFVTVGTQLPFDRLVAAVDRWAAAHPGRRVLAQVGPSALRPAHIEYQAFLSPAECRERMLAADAIVAHAGMGTILGALEMGRPLLVMPRRAALGEHRNDHQLATAKWLHGRVGVWIVHTPDELDDALASAMVASSSSDLRGRAPTRLIQELSQFIERA